ncbi:uncharacterized protein LOC135198966 [Macrobrachium nipponense]|uniref:uncharacterized protein LOC135198966 n=1 Tax=Macrobrachium nipponense TaxID=159736 RepID=UPI0030C7FBB0
MSSPLLLGIIAALCLASMSIANAEPISLCEKDMQNVADSTPAPDSTSARWTKMASLRRTSPFAPPTRSSTWSPHLVKMLVQDIYRILRAARRSTDVTKQERTARDTSGDTSSAPGSFDSTQGTSTAPSRPWSLTNSATASRASSRSSTLPTPQEPLWQLPDYNQFHNHDHNHYNNHDHTTCPYYFGCHRCWKLPLYQQQQQQPSCQRCHRRPDDGVQKSFQRRRHREDYSGDQRAAAQQTPHHQ